MKRHQSEEEVDSDQKWLESLQTEDVIDVIDTFSDKDSWKWEVAQVVELVPHTPERVEQHRRHYNGERYGRSRCVAILHRPCFYLVLPLF